jgi:hypothetical protein
VRATEPNVPTKEIRELRHKYRVAHTAYLSCVHALSDASEKEGALSVDIVTIEDKAFDDLADTRQAFLEGLRKRARDSK